MSEEPQRLSQSFIEASAGFIAGICSTCVAHPLDIVKTRLQLQVVVHSHPAELKTSVRIVSQLIREDGIVKGLYRGLSPNLVGNSTSWALYFLWYDKIKHGLASGRSASDTLHSSDYFVASGAAGALTAICTNPVWVIKTRMLSTSARYPGAYTSIIDGIWQIQRAEGLKGFYRGLLPSLFGVTHGALQFMIYETFKMHRTSSMARKNQNLSTTDYLAISGLAKILAGTVTYPYQLVRARLQMYTAAKTYRGVTDVMAQVWLREGLRGFYKGLGPNMLRVLPSTWVTFLVYEKSRLFIPKIYDGNLR